MFRIRHDVFFHYEKPDPAEDKLLYNIWTHVQLIHKQNQKIMATIEQFETALSRIDTATTNIANELRDLKDQIAGQGLSAEVEANVLARLEAKATQLEDMSQTVENPVPTEPGTGEGEQPTQ